MFVIKIFDFEFIFYLEIDYFKKIIDFWIKDKFKVKNFGGKYFFLLFLLFLS